MQSVHTKAAAVLYKWMDRCEISAAFQSHNSGTSQFLLCLLQVHIWQWYRIDHPNSKRLESLNCKVWRRDLQHIQWEIPSSMSLENLLRIRPVGVVSKNFMGLRRIRRKRSSWSLEDARSVPWQHRKHGSVMKGRLPFCHCSSPGHQNILLIFPLQP